MKISTYIKNCNIITIISLYEKLSQCLFKNIYKLKISSSIFLTNLSTLSISSNTFCKTNEKRRESTESKNFI